jgi:hypothetical protein
VYGVDRGATPAPAPLTGPSGAPVPAPGPSGSPRPGSRSNKSTVEANVKDKLRGLVHNLVALQVRVSELDRQNHAEGSSPLLTKDTGPATDINAILLPQGKTYLYTGVNDIGGPSSSFNFAAMATVFPHLQVGGGVLYSRLGARAIYSPGKTGLGFETRVYDLRHPTTDGYLNLRLGDGLTIFGGERDALRSARRTAFGLQLQF